MHQLPKSLPPPDFTTFWPLQKLCFCLCSAKWLELSYSVWLVHIHLSYCRSWKDCGLSGWPWFFPSGIRSCTWFNHCIIFLWVTPSWLRSSSTGGICVSLANYGTYSMNIMYLFLIKHVITWRHGYNFVFSEGALRNVTLFGSCHCVYSLRWVRSVVYDGTLYPSVWLVLL